MKDKLARSLALKTLVALPAALAGIFAARPAEAKGSKAQFKYQNTPKNGQTCVGCRFFVAGKTPTAAGTCTLVAGPISPKGWCIAWAKK